MLFHISRHAKPVLLLHLNLIIFSFVMQIPYLRLQLFDLPLIIFFNLICPISLLFNQVLISHYILFELRVLRLPSLEYTLHLNA